jgi:hypothetical protein
LNQRSSPSGGYSTPGETVRINSTARYMNSASCNARRGRDIHADFSFHSENYHCGQEPWLKGKPLSDYDHLSKSQPYKLIATNILNQSWKKNENRSSNCYNHLSLLSREVVC